MLILKSIEKEYSLVDTTVKALEDINIEFSENGFVSILGSSGCGKTTLLNIIGGLDRYTNGDLSINGKSTNKFSEVDWDTYRNNSIGFVFQRYNLIPHQTVLANVELALTLSGVSKAERRERSIAALKKVGLYDQLHKKPNQISCGQMQRVAIARALVNNPYIILADEPTGALDPVSSVRIMEILKEVSKDKLVIMVTNNPELAIHYSTRIIKLLDGSVIYDSNPYHVIVEKPSKKIIGNKKKEKKTFMTTSTVLSLSMNNLLAKRATTFMTLLAGSIAIIQVTLVLSLLHGVQEYLLRVEEKQKIVGMQSTIMEINSLVIAFAAILLVLSSILIGIITYISVDDRTKEIGILRSIGASKKDISRIINVEILIISFVAGIIGIGITLLFTIPINMLIKAITGVSDAMALPAMVSIVLILISMALNFLTGLIPSRIAVKKAPLKNIFI